MALPSIKDIARYTGVSTATVSRVINGHPTVTETTRRRVKAAMEHLGYTPNIAAQALVTGGKTRQIGIVVHEISHPFYSDFAASVHQVAVRKGYASLLLEASRFSLVDLLQTLRTRQVEGVILALENLPELMSPAVEAECRRLQKAGIPIVVIDEMWGFGFEPYPTFTEAIPIGVYEGARAIMDHLITWGHRHIGFLAPSQPLDEKRNLRYRAYRDALAEAKYPLGPLSNASWDALTSDSIVVQNLEDLLNQGPCTAIMVYNDVFAMAVLRGLHLLGVRVPEDVSVTGFDDLFFSRHTVPSLTTIQIDRQVMGAVAFQSVYERIHRVDKPSSLSISPRLIVRESTSQQR